MNTIEKPRLLVAIKNLKFQDAAIEKINLVEDDYSYIDRETQTIKFKKQIYIPFDVSKNTHLKGLKLCVFKNTNTKSFVVQFWHDNKAKYHVLGKYISGIFTTKHCSEKLFELFKSHTDNGLWIKDPSLTEKERRRVINIDQIEAAQNKTLCEAIVEYLKAGMPKIKRGGFLSARSAKSIAVYLIGYNRRFNVLKFQPTLNNDLEIIFKPKMWGKKGQRKNSNPTNFDELFKKYPPGIEEHIQSKKVFDRSIYDSQWGKKLLKDFTHGDIRRMLSKYSYGTQKHLIACINYVWAHMVKSGYLGDSPPKNPTIDYNINKERIKDNPKTINKKVIYSKEESKIIWQHLVREDVRAKFPFGAECLALMLLSGLREQEAIRIRKIDVQKKENIIVIKVSKLGSAQSIIITPSIRLVLNMIDEIAKRPGYQWVNFVPWLFCTPNFRTKDFEVYKDTDHGKNYINSAATAFKHTRRCWNYVKAEILKIYPDFKGSPKNFRKNYASATQKITKNSSDTIRLTRHTQASTLEKFYIGEDQEYNAEIANKVDSEFFDFAKLAAV
jgi:integrase